MESKPIEHHQSAHCETGVVHLLFQQQGISISEPMAFGIGSGLFFFYAAFIKVMGNPLIAYRSLPGSIFKRNCQRLAVRFRSERFRDPQRGKERLDELLGEGRALGIQANIYWLPYVPAKFRFHFNAHNLIVAGKRGDDYLISDPIVEEFSICDSRALTKARFCKGALAPKGLLYYVEGRESSINWKEAIREGIKETVNKMLYSPLPILGVRAIRYLAKDIEKWPRKLSSEEARNRLAFVVRMQEEIGTGGAGFRYMYSAFLDECGVLLDRQVLRRASVEMEEVGDRWRDVAVSAVGLCKERGDATFEKVARAVRNISEQEQSIYLLLKKEYLRREV